MVSLDSQAMERDELLQRRREGGAWLRGMRERAGLSQRELALAVGADYYSFVSQLESGKGRVPVAQVELWAKALKVRRSEFAKGLLKYYDPLTYDMLFNDEEAVADESKAAAAAPAAETADPLASDAPAPEKREPASQPRLTAITGGASPAGDDDLRARLNRLEAILMMRGAGV